MCRITLLTAALLGFVVGGTASIAPAQTGSIGGIVWLDEPPYAQYEGEDGIPDVGLNLFDDDIPIPCPVPGFDRDPFGQSRLGYFKVEHSGAFECTQQVIAGGLEDASQQFYWYWDYLEVEDNSTTPPCPQDGDDPALRKRVQAWMLVRNRDTGEEYNTSVFVQNYDTSLTLTRLAPDNAYSQYVTYTVDVEGPIATKADYDVRLLVRFQEWQCPSNRWLPPLDSEDFSWDTTAMSCENGGRVYRSPLCLLGKQTTDANGVYAFTGLDAGNYRVVVDPWNDEPGRPTSGLFSTTGNGGPQGITITLAAGQNKTENFGFADRLGLRWDLPTMSISGWALLVLGLLLLGAPAAAIARQRAGSQARSSDPSV